MIAGIIQIIKGCAINGNIIFKKHALIRIIERKILVGEIEEALQNCSLIESYLDDKPFISHLLIGYTLK